MSKNSPVDWFAYRVVVDKLSYKMRLFGVPVRIDGSNRSIPQWAFWVYWKLPTEAEESCIKRLAALSHEDLSAFLTLMQLDGLDGHEALRVFYFGEWVTCEKGHRRDVRMTTWEECSTCAECKRGG